MSQKAPIIPVGGLDQQKQDEDGQDDHIDDDRDKVAQSLSASSTVAHSASSVLSQGRAKALFKRASMKMYVLSEPTEEYLSHFHLNIT